MALRWDLTRRSKDFITLEVRATGLWSFIPVVLILFGNGDDGGGMSPHMACLQWGIKDVCEYQRQLIGTVLQGGGRDSLVLLPILYKPCLRWHWKHSASLLLGYLPWCVFLWQLHAFKTFWHGLNDAAFIKEEKHHWGYGVRMCSDMTLTQWLKNVILHTPPQPTYILG